MISQVKLDRISESLEHGTFGVLSIDSTPRFVTLERPWLGNQPNISCIPEGLYRCSKHDSPKFGSTYIVDDVFGRSDILFHWGNYVADTEGCILVGGRYSPYVGPGGILDSRVALDKFLELLKDIKSFQLLIRDFTKN